eukprot:1953039-Rhodomonas_salina.2
MMARGETRGPGLSTGRTRMRLGDRHVAEHRDCGRSLSLTVRLPGRTPAASASATRRLGVTGSH